MADKKFRKDKERNVTLLERKSRIIDLMENLQALPDVEWDAEPVRYFKLNKEWCKAVFGWLTWVEDEAGWLDAEDLNYRGIQGVIKFEEGIEGGIFMTPDEFKQSLYEGLYKWTNDVAKQIVSGGIGGFSVDEDGNVVVGGDATAELPEDDPETPQDENAEARNGAAIAVAYGLQHLYNKLFELFGIDSVPDTSLGDAQLTISQIFQVSQPAMDEAVAGYYDVRAALFSDYIALNVNEIAEVYYCSNGSIEAVCEYILDLAAPSETARFNIVELFKALATSQYAAWEAAGAEVPSLVYIGYGCTPIPYEEITLDMSTSNNPSKTTNGVWKEGHRYLIEASGSYVDTDVPDLVGDAMYFYVPSTGVKTFSTLNFNFDGSITVPTQIQVPYAADHKYRFTIEKNPGSGNASRAISRDNGGMNLPNVSGLLTIKITDLGKFA